MKLRKGKSRPKADENVPNKEEEKDNDVEQINTESQESGNKEASKGKHHLFENDNWD